MKININAILCAITTTFLCQAEPEANKPPTMLGVGVGSKVSDFLKMVGEKKNKKFEGDYGDEPAKMKADHEELLKKLESPEYEEKYIKNKGQYAWTEYDSEFEKGTVELLGLNVKSVRTQAIYVPDSDDFLMFNMSVGLSIPEGSSFVKTVTAIVEPQFGKPDYHGSEGASWRMLGPLETQLNISGGGNSIKLSLQDNGIVKELARTGHMARLKQYADAKLTPEVKGKLE